MTYGLKTVYAKLKNSTNESQVVSDTIELIDTTSVSLNSIVINSGDTETINSTVNVKFNITNSATHYRLGTSSDLSLIPWVDYISNEVQFTLLTYGNNTVYGQVKNNTSESLVQNDSITLLEPVTLNSMLINNGDVSASSNPVTFTFNYSGGTPTHYMVSEDSGFTTSSWIIYVNQPISYMLSNTSAGFKTIYLKLKNNVGESNIVSDTIEYVTQQRKMVIYTADNANITTGIIGHCGPVVNNGETANAVSTNYYSSYSNNMPLYDTTGAAWGTYTKNDSDVLSYIEKYGGTDWKALGGAASYNAILSGNLLKYPDEYYGFGSYIIFMPDTLIGARAAMVLKGFEAGTYNVNIITCVNEDYLGTNPSDPSNAANHIVAVNMQEKTRTPVTANVPNEILFENVVLETSGDITIMVWTPLRAELPSWGKAIIGLNVIEVTKIS